MNNKGLQKPQKKKNLDIPPVKEIYKFLVCLLLGTFFSTSLSLSHSPVLLVNFQCWNKVATKVGRGMSL